MDLITHKKKFTVVTSCTLTLIQAGGTGLLHLEISQLVEEATQHVSMVFDTFAASSIIEFVCGHYFYHYKPYCLSQISTI